MIIFSFREAKKNIFNTPTVSIFSILSLTVGILLILFSLLINQKKKELNKFLNESVFVTAYLEPNLNKSELTEIESSIRDLPEVLKIEFTSVADAKRKFISETGEDFSVFLDVNPLPASFQIWFKSDDENFDARRIDENLPSLRKIKGINEISFDASFQIKIFTWIKKIETYLFLFTGAILLLSCYIVFVTQRLGIQNRLSEIETMKLVGSKKLQIKMPFYFTSIIFSIIASLLSISFLYAIIYLLTYFSINPGALPMKYLALITLSSSMILSMIATNISLRHIRF